MGKKISELNLVDSLTDEDVFPVVQSGTTKKAKFSQIAQNIITGVEFATNTYIDGKRVYGKRIDCGDLVSGGTTTVSTGLTMSNLTIQDMKMLVHKSNDNSYFSINWIGIYYSLDGNGNLSISENSSYTYLTAVATIYYTKKS